MELASVPQFQQTRSCVFTDQSIYVSRQGYMKRNASWLVCCTYVAYFTFRCMLLAHGVNIFMSGNFSQISSKNIVVSLEYAYYSVTSHCSKV